MSEANDVAALAIKSALAPVVINVTDPETKTVAPVLLVPVGMARAEVQSALDARLPAPMRRVGVINVASIDAFLAMVNRHRSDSTVVYCDDGDAPRLTAVINDHLPNTDGKAGFRDHRVVYAPELSEQWKAWTEHDGEALSMSEFAQHLEDRALDMIDPAAPMPPSTKAILDALGVKAAAPSVIRGLARSLTIHESSRVTEARNLQSGEAQLVFESTHTDQDGKPLTVPGAFLVGIPIYKGGPGYLFVARLRYRKSGPSITWSYSLAQTDAAKREVMAEMVRRVGADAGVLVIEGQA